MSPPIVFKDVAPVLQAALDYLYVSMLMPSERNGPIAALRVVLASLATLITECESSDSWIRTAPYTEWVRSCPKGLTKVPADENANCLSDLCKRGAVF